MPSWNRSTSLRRELGAGLDRCPGPLHQRKIPPRPADVPANLLAQRVDGVKFDFIAQPLEKEQLDLGLGRERNGMKVEQVSFDGKGICAEGGTVTDVRHRVEAFFANPGAGDVDAITGYQLFITAQVNGWNRIFRAVAAAPARSREDAEDPG